MKIRLNESGAGLTFPLLNDQPKLQQQKVHQVLLIDFSRTHTTGYILVNRAPTNEIRTIVRKNTLLNAK